MKILITVEFYHAPGGGGIAEQARQIAEGLVLRGHEVTVATSFCEGRPALINGVRISGFRVVGSLVKGIRGEKEAYRRFILGGNYDVILNFAADTWTTDLAFEIADSIHARKVLSTPGLSKVGDPRFNSYYESAYVNALRKYDRIVYTSPRYRDKLFGDKHGLGDKAAVIPNGAGAEFLAPSIGFKSHYNITTPHLFLDVSNHFFAKGHQFVIEAFRRLNRDDATLVIIGGLPTRHSWYSCYPFCAAQGILNRRIRILGNVPRSYVVSAYQESDAFLFGSKLECAPLVMYESFASKTLFITTDIGNVRDHETCVTIVKTPKAMASAAEHFLEHKDERREITDRAFELWKRDHTWETIAMRYEALFGEIAKAKSSS